MKILAFIRSMFAKKSTAEIAASRHERVSASIRRQGQLLMRCAGSEIAAYKHAKMLRNVDRQRALLLRRAETTAV